MDATAKHNLLEHFMVFFESNKTTGK